MQHITSTGALTIPRPSVSDMTKAVATHDVMLSGTVTRKLLSVEALRKNMWKRLSKINSNFLKRDPLCGSNMQYADIRFSRAVFIQRHFIIKLASNI